MARNLRDWIRLDRCCDGGAVGVRGKGLCVVAVCMFKPQIARKKELTGGSVLTIVRPTNE